MTEWRSHCGLFTVLFPFLLRSLLVLGLLPRYDLSCVCSIRFQAQPSPSDFDTEIIQQIASNQPPNGISSAEINKNIHFAVTHYLLRPRPINPSTAQSQAMRGYTTHNARADCRMGGGGVWVKWVREGNVANDSFASICAPFVAYINMLVYGDTDCGTVGTTYAIFLSFLLHTSSYTYIPHRPIPMCMQRQRTLYTMLSTAV